jgi:hypothetical protein
MSRLLDVYEGMQKEAEMAQVQENVVLMLSKYAESAEALLTEEYGTDYDVNDVASLANGLMEHDAEVMQEREKVAEYDAVGRQLAHMFVENLQKEAKEKEEKEKEPKKHEMKETKAKEVSEKVRAESARGGE